MTRDEENSTVVVDGKAPGNTQYVAMLIRQKTGGSLFRLEPVTPYPREHRALVSLAEKEQAGDIRPEIAVHPISRRMTRSSPDIPTGGPRYAHAPLHVPRAAGSLRQSHDSLLYPRGERVLPHHRDNPEKTARRQSAGDGFRCLPAEYGHSAGWRRSLAQKNRIQPLAPVQPRRTG